MLKPHQGDGPPLRRRRSPAALLGEASGGGSEGMAQPDPMINFAQLDPQNWEKTRLFIRWFQSRFLLSRLREPKVGELSFGSQS